VIIEGMGAVGRIVKNRFGEGLVEYWCYYPKQRSNHVVLTHYQMIYRRLIDSDNVDHVVVPQTSSNRFFVIVFLFGPFFVVVFVVVVGDIVQQRLYVIIPVRQVVFLLQDV